MFLSQPIIAIFVAFTASLCFAAGSQEDYQLLEDSFAQAYADEQIVPESEPSEDVSLTKRFTIAKAQRYPRPSPQGRRNAYPAVMAPKFFNRPNQGRQDSSRRSLFFPAVNPLLPQRKTLLRGQPQNLASFARRDPRYNQHPKMIQTPRRNTLALARNFNRQRPSYMYNQQYYNSLYRRNPYMYPQRRNFMYPLRRPYQYPVRRPVVYSGAILRSRMPGYINRVPFRPNMFFWNRPQRIVYARDHSWSGNHLNLNTGTSSHTVSNSVLKAPGHTSTDTHVVNKQQTGGRVRGIAPKFNGRLRAGPSLRYPFVGKSWRARERVSASAKVNAKAAASTSSSSASQSGSTSKTNGGSRTTSSGGWGGGAGAGWGSGQNAWGIGYGGGGGGSNWKIPSNMVGIPGMPGKFPGIPSGFPGMPPGGYPSKGYTNAAPATNAKRPSTNLKGQRVSLKPQKGLKAETFQATKSKAKASKGAASKAKARPNLKTYSKQIKPKSTLPHRPGNVMRVQFFTSDALQRPTSNEWQKIRQRIISDVMRG